MPGLTYSTYVSSLANLLVVPAADPNFQTVLPNIIDDAELRIYRDLDLLSTNVTNIANAVSTSTRIFSLPVSSGTFIVVDQINLITPAGTVDPEQGTRNPLEPVSIDVLNALYPSSNGSSIPQYYARYNEGSIAFGPWPAAAYQAEITGTIRPAAISSTNTTTILSVYFPDLLISASMVFGAAYQKNFGSAVDDPKAAVTWESHYQTQLASASVEENRKKFQGPGWSTESPSPQATPPRT